MFINKPTTLCFNIDANIDQLPIQDVKINWGDGNVDTLSSMAGTEGGQICTIHTYTSPSQTASGTELCDTVNRTEIPANQISSIIKNDAFTPPLVSNIGVFTSSHSNVLVNQPFNLSWNLDIPYYDKNTQDVRLTIKGAGLPGGIYTTKLDDSSVVNGKFSGSIPSQISIDNISGNNQYSISVDVGDLSGFTCGSGDPFCVSSIYFTYATLLNVVSETKTADGGNDKCYAVRVDARDNWCWNSVDNSLNYGDGNSGCKLPSPEDTDLRKLDAFGIKKFDKLPSIKVKVK